MGGQQNAGPAGGKTRRAAEEGGERIRGAWSTTVKIGGREDRGRKGRGHNANNTPKILWANQGRAISNGAAGIMLNRCGAPARRTGPSLRGGPVSRVRPPLVGSLCADVAVVDPEDRGAAGCVVIRAQAKGQRAGAQKVRVGGETQLGWAARAVPRLALQLKKLPMLPEAVQGG